MHTLYITVSHVKCQCHQKRQSSTFVIAPQVDNATSGARRYMARTKQRRKYLSLTFPVLIYRPRKDGGLSKPRYWVQRATGPRLLRDPRS